MQIDFNIFICLISLVVISFLIFQFYKLGLLIKEKSKIFHRIYVIFWSLIGAAIVFFVLAMGADSLRSYEREKKESELRKVLNLSEQNVLITEKKNYELNEIFPEAKKAGLSDEDVYKQIQESKNTGANIKSAREAGFSDKEIARIMGLHLSE
jgi:Na+-translocating ferredoxin:NAD+ oxidoreductase RnfG subunit